MSSNNSSNQPKPTDKSDGNSQGAMSVQTYYERFKNQVDVIEHCGGTMLEPGNIKEEL
jgi:hypothetical protein